ncbi:MAG: TolC family protein [Gemmatimonadales bacterium]
MKSIAVLIIASLLPAPVLAQQPAAEAFVAEALAANRTARSERLALDRDRAARTRARRLYLPALSVEAQWTEQNGGADIGALVNPAFAALNRITGTAEFPTDVSFRFPLRQDARFRLAMPVFDAAIGAAIRAAEATHDGQGARLEATERDLTAALRTGLLGHAAASELVRVRAAVLEALAEQLRAAESRVAAGVDAPDVVLRTRADRSEGAQLLLEAEQARDAAGRALNRLARRPLDAPLPEVTDSTFAVPVPASLDVALGAVGGRAELAAAEAAVGGAAAARRVALAASVPAVQVALDYGWQGDSWRFTSDRDFAQLTVQARWTPFAFGRNALRRTEARLDAERAELARDEMRDQLTLEVTEAWEAFGTARAATEPARDRAAAAVRNLELVRRRWDEGVATHLELVSARAAATAAEVQEIVSRYQLAQARVALVRATTTSGR